MISTSSTRWSARQVAGREGFQRLVAEQKIDAAIDISDVTDAKFDALAAHASQTESSFFLKMGRERFRQFFGTEWFVRAIDPLGRTGVDHDLFAGWRD